ncbi:hypothetical protein AhSzq1_39 [Aeromonas phage AhSzq-1]|uniref:Uncharacterized protein n=2 Tax=Shenzhenvirus TaxID=2732038 RepID=A0A2R4ALL2_9CAUD|nr:hypothetical protein HOT03_gp039 [Aeromonas phage AhSzq-1]YP_009800227.1 hypothetical protein HOT04_gp034 [Aeromonas phage AhSzw-1]AVR75932.1 hypothetical protein AhSzq1_39 [Aeromonas phage AhSzq-1]AVR76070.1 hypothetical protein AhSzw1_34 [Aeromonas phage AhSzw-1]
MTQQVNEQVFAISNTQINNIIDNLDAVVKAEGISLRGAQAIITQVIQPLTSLQPITINEPAKEEAAPTTEDSTNE